MDWTVVEQMVTRGTFTGVTVALDPAAPASGPVAAHIAAVTGNLGRLHQSGLKMACGSDAGTSPHRPHGVLPHGVVTLARNGCTTTEAIDAATSVAAAACGVGHRRGRVAPGYEADLLAVAGDPLVDIEALPDVRVVYRAGLRVA